ncbi:MAG: EAL domain-containing protein [Leptospira sp.]|nr:EAL domain-containing protein [Leptospira sp.]
MVQYILSSNPEEAVILKNVLEMHWNYSVVLLNLDDLKKGVEDEPIVLFLLGDHLTDDELSTVVNHYNKSIKVLYYKSLPDKNTDLTNIMDFYLSSVDLKENYLGLLKRAILAKLESINSCNSLKLVEENLAEWENLFQDSLDIMFIIDATTKKIIEANHAANIVLGYTRDELIGRDFSFLSHTQESEKNDTEFHGYTIANHGLVTSSNIWIPMESTWRIFQKNGITHIFATFRDISERKASEEKIHFLAYYNPITNLPNKILFEDRLNQLIHDAKLTNRKFAIVTLDIDNFKLINETLGSDFGDKIIRILADRLRSLEIRESFFAHFGGDDFGLLLNDIKSNENLVNTIQKLQIDLKKCLVLEGREFFLTFSFGIAIYPDHGQFSRDLMKSADLAMYTAKEKGKNVFSIYNDIMIQKVHKRMELENDLRKAIQNDEFLLYFQPQISITSGELCGMEALVRWNHPQKGIVSPLEFIPVAEMSGLIQEIGLYVLKSACEISKDWIDRGLIDFPVSVNVSAKQWNNLSLSNEIVGILESTGLPSKLLTIELTESSIMEDPEKSIRAFQELLNQGIGLSVDDFGTGYSSLSYLKKLNVHHLKIDRSFVHDLEFSSSDRAISLAIINLAHSLGLNVVAEGVEKVEQLTILKEQGCDSFQGYLVSKPLSEKDFEELLRNYRKFEYGLSFS